MSEHNFLCNGNKGLTLPLPNGYAVSIQFGIGNYCEHNSRCDSNAPMEERIWKSYNAETAIISPSGEFVEYNGGEVQGYQSTEDVFKTILHASRL